MGYQVTSGLMWFGDPRTLRHTDPNPSLWRVQRFLGLRQLMVFSKKIIQFLGEKLVVEVNFVNNKWLVKNHPSAICQERVVDLGLQP